jgi:hypothetical protein
LPRYWTGFDVGINMLGYAPLGGLLALGVLRSARAGHAILLPIAVAATLALVMEALQSYLPARVPSREDWLLDTLGAVPPVRWCLPGWVLLTVEPDSRWLCPIRAVASCWRCGLLVAVSRCRAIGLGQVLERVEAALAEHLVDTPFLNWLPLRETELQPLVPGAEMVCVWLGLLIPCLLGFCLVRARLRRVAFVLMTVGVGVGVSALSAALSWGPAHAWAWLGLPAQLGMVMAVLLALVLAFVPWRASAALLLVSLGVYLSLLNQAPESAYFAQTLQAWEQGRFIRFHGLAQWLGWLWPYAALVYVLSLMGAGEPKN